MSRLLRAAHTLREGAGIAVEAIRANKVRSGLTILGVGIGVMVVMAMAAMVTGIRSTLLSGIEAAGPRNFIVARFDFSDVRLVNDGSGRPPWWDKPKITPREANRIAALPAIAEAVVDFDFNATIERGSRRVVDVQAAGDGPGWTRYTTGTFTAGRNFLDAEVAHARPVVVISKALAEELFGSLDPVGRTIRVGNTWRSETRERFTVVGIFELEENIFTNAVRHFAVFPYTAALKRLKADDTFLSVLAVPAAGVSQDEAMDQVVGVMRSMRGLRPWEENDFFLIRQQQLVETFNDVTAVFFLVMIALSSVGLLVGGVGVIGVMMIAVTERTREVGIRMAVGATRREILWQFLVESGTLTLVGGAVGMALGGGISWGIETWTPVPASVPLWSVGAALAVAALTGILFGIVPAYRASRLDPVVALGYE